VEQPELHLHPKLQAELGELFAEVATAKSPKQVIVETHSENLILRVQRLVRDGRLSADQVSVLYVGANAGIGSWIQPIRLSDDGSLMDEWPGGFFPERMAEW
jgi:predicted ATPase